MRISIRRRLISGFALATGLALAGAVPALAHDHYAERAHQGAGQVLANGANHPVFRQDAGATTWTSCESYGPIPGDTIGKAWYGLETAHHGPDSGAAGRSDGCYTADDNPRTGDDRNPAIR